MKPFDQSQYRRQDLRGAPIYEHLRKHFFTTTVLFQLCILSFFGGAAEADNNIFQPFEDQFGTIKQLANEEVAPFRLSGSTIDDGPRILALYGDLVEEFPSVLDCLLAVESVSAHPDLTKVDWSNIDSIHAAEVCFFRIASSYEGREAFLNWSQSFGFKFDEWKEEDVRGQSGWVSTSGVRSPDQGEPLFFVGFLDRIGLWRRDFGVAVWITYDEHDQLVNLQIATHNK